MTSLDIPEKQVLWRDEEAGAGDYLWLMYLLVHRLTDQKWVAINADWEIVTVDLSATTVLPLQRAADFPARVRERDVFAFDAEVENFESNLAAARIESSQLYDLLSDPSSGIKSSAGVWRYSDVAHPQFADRVDDAYLVEATCVVRDSVALVQAGENWTSAERVSEADLQLWRDEKANGPGRDRRLLEPTRDSGGSRFISLVALMATLVEPLLRPKADKAAAAADSGNADKVQFFPKDWPFRGPSTTMDLLRSVRASGCELLAYSVHWANRSGVSDGSPSAKKHRDMMSCLAHFLHYDQLNATLFAGVEILCRMILQIESAVLANPKAPVYTGLENMIGSRLDSGGAALQGEYAQFVADEQKTAAFAMKQQRLAAEEQAKLKGPAKT